MEKTNKTNGEADPCPCPSYTDWKVSQVTGIQSRASPKYAVLILNRPITQSESYVTNLWNNAQVRMTVDGGTTRWDSFLDQLSAEVQAAMKRPDLITGDFDSIKSSTMAKYKDKGCKFINTPDQNHTDFTKALMELKEYCSILEIHLEYVAVIGQCSGRIDQILGTIHTLYMVKEQQLFGPDVKVYFISDDSISWLLKPGEHVISIPKEISYSKKAWCSLVPVGEPCKKVSTTGLKWNLNGQTLKFGDLVSTSNAFDRSENVEISCSHTILWSMRVPSLWDQKN